ncbi:MAG: hypothetical protein M1831_002339 [Alyxoria varia]|nr:MAG: hypothetical protein M1831_002339 [Alyxoria varia]
MSPLTTTKQWLYNSPPKGIPSTSGPSPTFTLTTQPIPTLEPNQLLLKTLYLSNDPAQRGWISPIALSKRFYAQPVPVNTPMRAHAICEVLETRDERFQKGDHVVAASGWSEYAVLQARECQPAPPIPVSETHYLGALGATGMTAYFGIVEVARAKPTDVVVVSGAAGATGSMVIQIARHLLSCRKVIGIAGGKSKCDFVKSLGADDCVDYKSDTFKSDLYRSTDRQADVFFDNVGGEVFNLMLGCMAKQSRVAVCGLIAGYNDEKASGFQNWHEVISQRIEIKGFVIFDFWHRREIAMEALRKGLAERKLKIGDQNETVVRATFEQIPNTWLKLFEGANTGKLITKLVDYLGDALIHFSSPFPLYRSDMIAPTELLITNYAENEETV